MERQKFRAAILAAYGATESEIEELLVYNQNVFEHDNWQPSLKFPLEPELHIETWENYAVNAREIGVFETLKQVFVQFSFPIQEGISQTEAYRAATLKGVNLDGISEATDLVLEHPDKLDLKIYQSLAGAIPVILPGNREDFVSLVRSLTKRNEPQFIPDSMGACMVAGYNNWDRIRRYRQQWERENPANCSETAWTTEFKRLIPDKNRYQDRFIILSDGFYSNVSPSDIGLPESEWRRLSLTIRLEHECTHYLTRRLFNSMQNNLLDELIADYRGIVAATGGYRADWFLRFMGLESLDNYRESGRLQNYRGEPPLSDGAFRILQALVTDAALNLERFDAEYINKLSVGNERNLLAIALTYSTLEELASQENTSYLVTILEQLETES
ncbi:DUF7005 family protein [Nostoc punctiforme]|uniref:Uncharacterized protein n=1 Tax=Nostoc punctiforme (strain ATCC 29133 / PCC 73102) TaxID=63737 RepID=B2IYT6_NOSP7|nr:hypothetical protein [Nostoc punctiforme]ACC81669.1 conserved hypothetical protein [Nostoc punctiforme PCC 73102]